MNIMKAGKKPVTEYTLADLGLDLAVVGPQRDVLSNLAEEQDRKRIMLQGGAAEQAEALANALIKEGVLEREPWQIFSSIPKSGIPPAS
jgi:electron transfer flavoprotein alpha/beta subunit